MIEHQIIDDVLPSEQFEQLSKIVRSLNYGFVPFVSSLNDEDNYANWYFVDHLYNHDKPLSSYYNTVINIIDKYIPDLHSLVRIKANFFPWTHKVYEHSKHVDYDFTVKSALISINTCNGYTRLDSDTTVDSIANRMLIFDSSKPHNSTTTSNAKGRFNLNINYL